MLVFVVNHEENEAAIALAEALRAHADVLLMDSGSRLSDAQRQRFDIALPNVYYSGLVNAACEEGRRRPEHGLYAFITSDVVIDDPADFVRRCEEVFADPGVGLYAPCAQASGHPQMLQQGTQGLRRVTYVEGFCFALRARIFQAIYPVDTALNALGHGLDIQLGFLAAEQGYATVVDDRVQVFHPQNCGYDAREASRQRFAWVAQLSRAARRFHRWASWAPLKSRWGMKLLLLLLGLPRKPAAGGAPAQPAE